MAETPPDRQNPAVAGQRDEIELEALGAALGRAVRGTVVHETMRPAHVSLWIRRPETPR